MGGWLTDSGGSRRQLIVVLGIQVGFIGNRVGVGVGGGRHLQREKEREEGESELIGSK